MSDSDPDAGERYNQTLAHCHPLSLLFDGKWLTMFAAGKVLHTYPASSGKPLPSSNGKPKFDYSSARQKLDALGPIPAGTYWVAPDELWEKQRVWGRYRLTIHPFASTLTHGRGNFFVQSGATQGDAGCIDLSTHMDKFVEDVRAQLGTLLKCQIHLTVDYRMRD